MLNMIKQRWDAPGGYGQALRIGLPLVVSMASTTIMNFTDKVFLGNYSLETLAASLPAGMLSFLLISFFMGTGEYVGVFVAQYTGACRTERVGAALWQGLWFALPSSMILAAIGLFGVQLFTLGGHDQAIVELEATYFFWMSMGGGGVLFSVCLSTFYSGRGLTMPVMLVNLAGAALNVPLDYALINGAWGFPELGMAGAGMATALAGWFNALLFALLVFRRRNAERFGVRANWRFDPALFWRFLRFGVPGGVQFFLDMAAITFFFMVVGRMGTESLAATNMAISLNILGFLPMIGLSIAASVMVGQSMGAGQPDRAVYSAYTVLHLALVWMVAICLLFVLAPEPLLRLFQPRGMTDAEFASVVGIGRVLMRFVAAYSLGDAVVLAMMGALKGAGDTRFTMLAMGGSALGAVVVPVLVLQGVFGLGLYAVWSCLFVYVLTLAAVFWRRFVGGAWKRIQVIEPDGPVG